MNDQGEPGLNSPETEEALTYHKKFAELMPGETEYATVNTLFKEGMAHATIAGPWLIPTVRESGMDVGIAPMPVIDETGTPISPYMGVQGIQVLRNAAENAVPMPNLPEMDGKPNLYIQSHITVPSLIVRGST